MTVGTSTAMIGDFARVAAADIRGWATSLRNDLPNGAASSVRYLNGNEGPLDVVALKTLGEFRTALDGITVPDPAAGRAITALQDARGAVRLLAASRSAGNVDDVARHARDAHPKLSAAAAALDELASNRTIVDVRRELSRHVAQATHAPQRGTPGPTFRSSGAPYSPDLDARLEALMREMDERRVAAERAAQGARRAADAAAARHRAADDSVRTAAIADDGILNGGLAKQLAWVIDPHGSGDLGTTLRTSFGTAADRLRDWLRSQPMSDIRRRHPGSET